MKLIFLTRERKKERKKGKLKSERLLVKTKMSWKQYQGKG